MLAGAYTNTVRVTGPAVANPLEATDPYIDISLYQVAIIFFEFDITQTVHFSLCHEFLSR